MLELLPLLATIADAPKAPTGRMHRPTRAESFWAGLDTAKDTAPSQGVQAVREAPGGRVRVPGGRFTMGSTPTEMMRAVALCRKEILRALCDEEAPGFRAEGIAHEVTISPFLIDKTEVTVGAYNRCVAAGACAEPGFAPGDRRFDRPELPVVNVRWDDADNYCRWAGGRLPTEAEWEYAARGPTSRTFPWGNVYNGHLANHGAFAADPTDASDGFAGLAPVGSFPDGATALGVLDMAGNAAEWVADIFEVDENGFSWSGKPRVDPKGKTTGGFHVVRGGSYLKGAAWIRGASRSATPLARTSYIGFRCAADLGAK